MSQLFTPVRIGSLSLPNRMVMAPMTRSRADDAGVPDEVVTYYAQRSSAGLIITEGVFPSATGKGYVRTPGIHSDAQVAAWKRVTEAVHARGGRIFMQLVLRRYRPRSARGKRYSPVLRMCRTCSCRGR